ncbi:hypothetical protein ACFL6C_12730 [Myxococcota bacterium]
MAMKVESAPNIAFVRVGLKNASKNDLGTARKILKEWPEDVYLTGAGIEVLDVNDSVKAILIFEQMKRIDGDRFLLQAHASSLGDVFMQAVDKAEDRDRMNLWEDWWIDPDDPEADLRVKEERSLDKAMPKFFNDPATVWCFPYEVQIDEWHHGFASGRLYPDQAKNDQARPLGFIVRPDQVCLRPDNDSSVNTLGLEMSTVPTELLENLVVGLETYLPEKTKDPELKKLRKEAEDKEKASVRPMIDAMQAVLDRRAEALAQAKSNLEGGTQEKVSKRSKKSLSQLAQEAVRPERR